MIQLDSQDIANALSMEHRGATLSCANIIIDSRLVESGDVFVALVGERVDAHRFIADVVKKEPAVIIYSDSAVDEVLGDYAGKAYKVTDCLVALGAIARSIREGLSGPCIAITGSAGKTTVKGMVAEIMALTGPGVVTAGNFNNEVGVPLTLFNTQPEDQYGVIEMGAAKLNDIAYLCSIARPDISVVTNVLPAHIEGFGSLSNVAKTKGEIYQALNSNGVAVVNVDGDYADYFLDHILEQGAKAITVSTEAATKADFYAFDIELVDGCPHFTLCTPSGVLELKLNVIGQHNVYNALIAAALAYAAGVRLPEIEQGLNNFKAVSGRMNLLHHAMGARVIDDSYNANPGSVRKAIDSLESFAGKRIIVLGNMAELGADEVEMHCQIGDYLNAKDVDMVVTIGELAANIGKQTLKPSHHCSTITEITELLKPLLNEGSTILIKGSRSAGLDQLVDQIMIKD